MIPLHLSLPKWLGFLHACFLSLVSIQLNGPEMKACITKAPYTHVGFLKGWHYNLLIINADWETSGIRWVTVSSLRSILSCLIWIAEKQLTA